MNPSPLHLLGSRPHLRAGAILLALVLVLLAGGALAQSGSYRLVRSHAGAGAGYTVAGSYRLGSTAGQPAVALQSGGAYALQAGFWSPAPASPATVHVMAVLSFDNNLSAQAPEVIENFRLGTAANPNAIATLLVDQSGPDNTEVVEVANGVVTHTGGVPWLPGAHELDTANPDTLAAFFNWARAAYPSGRTVAALLGHGIGLAPEIHLSQGSQNGVLGNLPWLPKDRDNTPSDVTSGTYLSTPELGRGLASATAGGTAPFDVLFIDSCFEGNLDVLYEVHAAAQALVASPSYAWAGFFYDRYLPFFTPGATPDDIAQAIVTQYEAGLDDNHPNAILWVRGADVPALGAAVSNLGDTLSAVAAVPSGAQNILDASLASRFVDTSLCTGDLDQCPPDELIGAGSFAAGLRARFPAGSPVDSAADQLEAQLANVHGAFRTGHPWVRPDRTWAYTDTITILAPLTRTLTVETSWRHTIYTSTAPLNVTYQSGGKGVPAVITTPVAYTVDGRWDDFLAGWYGPASPTVGALCQIYPPALPVNGTATVALSAQAGLNGVQLSWTAPTLPGQAGYQVYARWPGEAAWELVAATASPSYLHAGLPSGAYTYFVAAVDASGQALARSNEVTTNVGITQVEPGRGLNSATTLIMIGGAGFAAPVTVTVGGVALVDASLVSPGVIRATVPAGLAPGLYTIVVGTPAGQAVAYAAFEALDGQTYDDLTSSPDWLWTEPNPLRAGTANSEIGLTLQRLGGSATLDSAAVEFRLGGPAGAILGRAWTSPLPPYTTTVSSPVAWTPPAQGTYQVCALIDPDNVVVESDETNNVVCRPVQVLPPAADLEPPVVQSLTINHGGQVTTMPTVTLTVAATDYPIPGASGLAACKFVEFEYSFGAQRWVPVQQSPWVSYAAAHADYTWRILPSFGLRVMQAWCADAAGNISRAPALAQINLLPTTRIAFVAERGVVLYRIFRQAGEPLAVRLSPVSGDPDLYVWGPAGREWYSNNSAGDDVVSFNAPAAGLYQIEVRGYTAAGYRLSLDLPARSQPLPAQVAGSKPVVTDPAVPLSNSPVYFEVNPVPTQRYYQYLPYVRH